MLCIARKSLSSRLLVVVLVPRAAKGVTGWFDFWFLLSSVLDDNSFSPSQVSHRYGWGSACVIIYVSVCLPSPSLVAYYVCQFTCLVIWRPAWWPCTPVPFACFCHLTLPRSRGIFCLTDSLFHWFKRGENVCKLFNKCFVNLTIIFIWPWYVNLPIQFSLIWPLSAVSNVRAKVCRWTFTRQNTVLWILFVWVCECVAGLYILSFQQLCRHKKGDRQ